MTSSKKRIRGFEPVSNDKSSVVAMPQRATSGSAGYDIRANETVMVPSFVRRGYYAGKDMDEIYNIYKECFYSSKFYNVGAIKWFCKQANIVFDRIKPIIVHTGIKAYFKKTEALGIYNRSSNPIKRGLYLCNGVGVTDSDYYDSNSKGGEIMAEFINLGTRDYVIHKGDRIVQGVFMPILLTDDDHPKDQKRSGGFGSTD